MQDSIKETTLRALIEAGSNWAACVIGEAGGFSIEFSQGDTVRRLASTRGETRKFASLNTALDFLKNLGIHTFTVNGAAYRRGRIRKPRPDRAEALRKTRTLLRQQDLLPLILEP